MDSIGLDSTVRPEVVTYALVGEVVAINVEDGQNVDIHLVEQAGHLRVSAVGGQSLRKNGKKLSSGIFRRLCINICHAHAQVSSLPP